MPKKNWTLSCKSAVRSYMVEMQVSKILGHLFPPCSKGKQRCFCHESRGGWGIDVSQASTTFYWLVK